MAFLNCFWIFLILLSCCLNVILSRTATNERRCGVAWSLDDGSSEAFLRGDLRGKYCVQIKEIPYKYFCFQKLYGDDSFIYASEPNPVDGICCKDINELVDPHTQRDNYICVETIRPSTTVPPTTTAPPTTAAPPTTTTTPTTTTSPATTATPTTTAPPCQDECNERRSCLIPNDLPNKLTVYYGENQSEIISSGSFVADATWITYKCGPPYVLVGDVRSLCFNGIWIPQHPKCRKN